MKLNKIINHICNILKRVNHSHLVSFSLGILIPIYADVLFIHGYNSATTSAIMTTITTSIALIAAYQVRDFYKKKIDETGFDLAKTIMFKSGMLKQDLNNLCVHLNSLHDHLNTTIEVNEEEYISHLNELASKHHKVTYDFDVLRIEIDNLCLWELTIDDKLVSPYLTSCKKLITQLYNSMNSMDINNKVRNESWLIDKQKLALAKEELIATHYNILRPFNEIFKKNSAIEK